MATKHAFDFLGNRNLLGALKRKVLIEITVAYNGTATPDVVSDVPGITAALDTGVTTLSGCPRGDATYARVYPGIESRAGTIEQVKDVHFDPEADTLHFTTATFVTDSIDPTDPANGDKVHLLLSYGMLGQ